MNGNDNLWGGADGDTMNGGDGDDLYHFTTGDTIIELAGEGTDRSKAGSRTVSQPISKT